MAFTTTDQHESGMSANRAEGTALHGMKAICEYAGKCENTVLKYVREQGFPASKRGGEWVSDKGRIDDWFLGNDAVMKK